MTERKNDVLRQQHREARATAKRMDRQLRNLYFFSKNDTTDKLKMWKVMNALTSRHFRRQEPKAIIDELSTAFGDVVTDDSRAHMLTCPQGPILKTSFFKLKEVSVDYVLTCLNAVDPHKAVGSDQVAGVLLKSCSTVLAGPLDKIINGSLSAGYVPMALKLSHISPLSKYGDVSEPKPLDPCPCYPLCRGSLGISWSSS